MNDDDRAKVEMFPDGMQRPLPPATEDMLRKEPPEYEMLVATLLATLDEIGSKPGSPPKPLRFPSWHMLEKHEQEVAIAVFDTLRVTPEYWAALDKPSRVPWLEKLIAKLTGSPEPKSEPEPQVESGELSDDAFMTHLDLAKALGLDPEALRSRLNRWRRHHAGDDGWHEVTEPKRGQPKYVYRVGAVRDVLREAKPK